MGLWSYPVPECGKGMTLIELPIKMSKNEDLIQRPTNSPEHPYGCYTMIATSMHYFSSMPSALTKADEALIEEEQCTSTK